MPFQKATRTQKKLRMALDGPSGSGKTYTALELATGLGGRIAVIDTERGSASLYADRFTFDVLELDYFSVDRYIAAISDAAEAGYDVLIIDSLTHAWAGTGGVLDAVNNTKGNTFTDGWGKVGTPQQNRLMDAILSAPMHVIATIRTKTAYEVERDERGKAAPKKIGLAPVQRDGVEYEFDITGSLSPENTLSIEKSRMIDLSGRIIPRPTRELARQIHAWLTSGAAVSTEIKPDDMAAYAKIVAEESARIAEWKKQDNGALVAMRAAIIESYKAVKEIAAALGLREAIANNPASSSKSAAEICKAADALALACASKMAPTPVNQ